MDRKVEAETGSLLGTLALAGVRNKPVLKMRTKWALGC